MNMDVCTPILVVDLLGSACMIGVSALCLREAGKIVEKEPENFLYGYMYWLFAALFAFSLSRSLGHIVKHALLASNHSEVWISLSPVSGSVNSALFLLIASITVFFQKMKNVMERLEQDKAEIERISKELLRLNRETERLVSERTRAELALSIAHSIRNPIMVIGGLARRFLKKEGLAPEQRKKVELMLEQIRKLDEIVKEFELLKAERTSAIAKRDLNLLVRQVVDSESEKAARKGLKTHVRYEKGPLHADIDPDMVRFALGQCLDLIVQRAEAGSTIEIALEREKFGAAIIFKAPAGGREDEAAEEGSAVRRYYSAGGRLGLSAVRQIIEDHGGRLQVSFDDEELYIELFLPFSIGTAGKWKDLDGVKQVGPQERERRRYPA